MTIWRETECISCGQTVLDLKFAENSHPPLCKNCSSEGKSQSTSGLQAGKAEVTRISIRDKNAVSKFNHSFFDLYRRLNNHGQTPLVFCIGSDRSTGDALGPLVGSRLKSSSDFKIPLMGTLEEPVHATNLKKQLSHAQNKYHHPFIIAIDASLGSSRHVGTIALKEGPLHPGSGVKKDLPAVGNMNIIGVVNISGFMEFQVLQSTRLNLVMKIVEIITRGLSTSLRNINLKASSSL